MATILLDDVQKGWKVYMGADQVGEVADVGEGDLGVKRGALLSHVVRVPKESVIEAADGVVDLSTDDQTKQLLENG